MKYSNGTSGSTSSSSSSFFRTSTNATNWTVKCTDLPQFDALLAQADQFGSDDKLHLRNLCNDTARQRGLTAVHYSTTAEPAAPSGSLPGSFHDENNINNNNGINGDGNNNAIPPHQQQHQVFHRKMILDYSRQRVLGETMELLFDLSDAVGLVDRREAFRDGQAINLTAGDHGQPVLHFLLRNPDDGNLHPTMNEDSATTTTTTTTTSGNHYSNNNNNINSWGTPQHHNAAIISPCSSPLHSSNNGSYNHHIMSRHLTQIFSVRRQIADFSQLVRSGSVQSVKQRPFCNTLVLCSSRGGYQSGPEFVTAALAQDPVAGMAAAGRRLNFVSSNDPSHVQRITRDLDPAETMVILISMANQQHHDTYSHDSETMLNVKAVKTWLIQNLAVDGITEQDVLTRHFALVTTEDQVDQTVQELLDLENPYQFPKHQVFTVCDWVNPRYSLCSAAGLLPLALQFGMPVMEQLLEGAHDMDLHFFDAPLRDNLPVILGLLGVWNSTFLGYSSRVILPYADALRLFPAHVQQVDMESNGKRVALDGTPLLHRSGEINVTTAPYIQQQSLFQLLHQGRVIPVDFIGFMESQTPANLQDETSSNHDELMSHFFAEPDALAYGKTLVDLIQEGTPDLLREHMVCSGNRPSSSLLCTKLDAFCVGQLLALYEHRTAVQGFMWGLNSFDQFGIELGRVLATHVRAQLSASRKTGASVQGFNSSTSSLLEQYLAHGKQKQQHKTNST